MHSYQQVTLISLKLWISLVIAIFKTLRWFYISSSEWNRGPLIIWPWLILQAYCLPDLLSCWRCAILPFPYAGIFLPTFAVWRICSCPIWLSSRISSWRKLSSTPHTFCNGCLSSVQHLILPFIASCFSFFIELLTDRSYFLLMFVKITLGSPPSAL